jgi:hypothetical protein
MSGIVQIGFMGGFGNQLHQYVAARKYAESVGAEFEVPDWVGRDIFELTDRSYSRPLPGTSDPAPGQTDIRLSGFFQTQRWIRTLSRAEIRKWLVVRPHLLQLCLGVVPSKPYTAAHVRRGDYVGCPFYALVAERSYLRACSEYGLGPIDAWVQESAPRAVAEVPSFLPDFVTLMHASVLLRANSTFSWWAAVLGDADVYSPVVTDHVGEYDADFVRGNWPMIAGREIAGVDDLHLPE